VLQPTLLNPNTVVLELQQVLASLLGDQVEIGVSLSDETGRVRMDRSQLEQVLINLAVNTRDAIADTGRFDIATRDVHIDPSEHRPSPYLPGRYVLLSIADDGAGMDDATRSRAFEPFFTTKPPGSGSGLGLAVVHGIVSQSHGYIHLESEVGRGTRFDIYLPVTPAP
jgi:signal transduction histidine kinase